MAKAKYTQEFKQNFIAKVEALRLEGVSVKEACKRAGRVNPVTYRQWKKALPNTDTKVVVHTAKTAKTRKYTKRNNKVESADKVFMFVGSPRDVAEVMRSL